MGKYVKSLSLVTCIGMLIVLMMGVLVSNTGSELGCGNDWPLCNGKFVPSYTLESLIEWNHRAVTGVEGILVAVTFFAVWRYVRRFDARLYVTMAAFFTVLQAILGAMAVVWSQSSAVMALHFGFSLMAFASTYLLYRTIREIHTTREREISNSRVNGSIRSLAWLSAIFTYIVVYLGAYVKHTNSSGACTDWPLCNGKLIPDFSGGAGEVFAHRTAGLLLCIFLVVLLIVIRRSGRSDLIRTSNYVVLFVVLQIISGVLLTAAIATEWFSYAGMLHILIIAGLFAQQTHLVVSLYPGLKRDVKPRSKA
ncbi:COX15/CtaA family protein [Gorillibacterium massiliense]|uniref:COX15/CtaA family protein n=1 Tax=Gorillibacterium massiliense TaxID=1280390 RepID=UPI0004BA6965|nr:COX15/CtaA family protein [Gorillibacterium massiliense]